ncbi:MAG: N-6 DNA methylase [Bacteroidales bacterium]|nr:N-6 DNA methylase [Bacteroidales bacterium]
MNTENLRQLFQSGFDYKQYTNEIVHNLFGCNDVAIKPELLDTSAEGDRSHYIGRMEETEGRLLGFFYTRVAEGSDVRRKRVGLRKLIAPYLKYDVDAAIAVFDDGTHWRLSYICDMKDGATAAKRFSYILGDEKGQYKTPLERLDKIASRYGRFKLEDLKDAFSVDSLSDEFFKEYHRHYDTIIDYLVKNANLDVKDSILHDYVKKMMGRIVFLHFLQKKGWLNDDTNYLKNLFAKQETSRQADFLEKVLEPLFFGIFNTESDKRMDLFEKEGWDPELLEQWCDMPYLNGGLFERDEVDKMRITLPSRLFEDLFNFMASYNFTVDENDPDDAEIGVDPEMLGKIFESLLEDNKAKGAFYTPKEIVRYMCKESLIAYLCEKVSDNTAEGGNNKQDSQDFESEANRSIRRFVETHELPAELEPYCTGLSDALREVKICDPAIGSGAFPMGLLNELWRCREAIEETSSRAALKKEIIENNIYGVDIEKGAIDIARLRFWLSIVVDADKPEPLPNFDYKFMQGNSLIESYKGIDLSRISSRLRGGQSKSTQLLLGLDSDFSKKNLQRLMRDYFSVTDHKHKASMRQAINDEVKRLITDFIGGTASDLEALDPSANQDFFLWHTWFKDIFDNGGFDIVIGNPPYGAYLSAEEKEYYRILYPETQFKIDTYSLFVLLSLNIMNSIGTTYFIIPNTLLDNYYEEKVREKILKYHTLIEICDLSDNIFQSAVVHSMIIGYSKRQNDVDIRIKTENVKNEPMMIPAHYFLRQPQICISYRNYAYQNLFDKLEKNSVHLQDVLDIRQTIKTGNDKIYICTERKADNFMPILRGKDICRYGYQYPGLYVNYGKHLANPIRHDIFEQPKILIREAGAKIVAAYDDKNYYIMSSLYNAILKDNYFNLKYLLSLINSRLFQFIMNKLTFEKTKGAFTKARIFHYYLLPVKKVPIKVQNQFIALVDNAMEKKEKDFSANIDDIENEIDNMVYQLYNLSPEEIAIIEKNAQ